MADTYNRIISLVPSLTELLFYFGLKDRLAGRTRFCIHPEPDVEDIPIIGGTKNPRFNTICEVNPDFILANKEENRKEDIEKLEHHFHVHLTQIATIEDALIAIHRLGKIFDRDEKAKDLTSGVTRLLKQRPEEPSIRTAYLIWRDPWMTVGSDTYIHDVMSHWNLENVFEEKQRYPKIKLDSIKQRKPQLVLLSSEPFPFKEKHVDEVKEHLPDTRVLTVEGEWFSWYGARMMHAFDKLNTWRKAIS
ncbi:MAG: helical backbone metal receptor [Balneolaceae bacterium]|nr:helical backbone metal receptor [Balneolaceae bacterium]